MAPVLFSAAGGEDYVAYEAVVAIGEIKSTYYRRDRPVSSFINTIRQIRTDLQRDQTHGGERPYGNPLFSFVIFMDSGDLDIDTLSAELYSTDPANCPNIICFLDRGVVVYTTIRAGTPNEFIQLHVIPEFAPRVTAGLFLRWSLLPVGVDGAHAASVIGILATALNTHIQSLTLAPAELIHYMDGLFGFQDAIVLRNNHDLAVASLRVLNHEPTEE